MGGSMKGSQKQSSTQTNEPPKWAKPLLERTASEAMGMFDRGEGYNTYRGPTQAEFSPQKLAGLNKMMTMTGGGPAVTNEAIFGKGNAQIQQVRDMIAAQQLQQQQSKAAQAAAAAAAAQKPKANSMDDIRAILFGMKGPGYDRAAGFGDFNPSDINARLAARRK